MQRGKIKETKITARKPPFVSATCIPLAIGAMITAFICTIAIDAVAYEWCRKGTRIVDRNNCIVFERHTKEYYEPDVGWHRRQSIKNTCSIHVIFGSCVTDRTFPSGSLLDRYICGTPLKPENRGILSANTTYLDGMVYSREGQFIIPNITWWVWTCE